MLLVFTLKRSSASVEGKRRGERERGKERKKRKKEEPFHERRGCKIYGGEGRRIREGVRVEQNNDTLKKKRRSLGESNLEK